MNLKNLRAQGLIAQTKHLIQVSGVAVLISPSSGSNVGVEVGLHSNAGIQKSPIYTAKTAISDLAARPWPLRELSEHASSQYRSYQAHCIRRHIKS